jgi:death on curing protein
VKYITEKDILVIHALLTDDTGGSYGIRDVGLIKSAVARPQMIIDGKEAFPGVFEKGATYFDSIARHHTFIDGNKRTAITVTSRFLFLNGFEVQVSNKEMVDFVLRVATEKLDIKEIADWLEDNSKSI